MSSHTNQPEIVDSESVNPTKSTSTAPENEPFPPKNWEPFAYAPENIRKRCEKQLKRCHSSAVTAIKMCCIECMGYSYAEPKRCDAITCPLYAFNRKIFTGAGKKKQMD